MNLIRQKIAVGLFLGALLMTGTAPAEAQSKIDELEQQIKSLQAEVQGLKEQQRQEAVRAEAMHNQAAQAAAAGHAVQAEGGGGTRGTYHVGGDTLNLGGFVEAARIYRSRNDTADVGRIFASNRAR